MTESSGFDLARVRAQIIARFSGAEGCWLWNRDEKFSRPTFRVKRLNGTVRSMGAHRASFLAFVGDIPEEMLVCHRCAMAACVNPRHLYLGNASQNMRDRFDGDVMHISDAEKVFRLSRAVLWDARMAGTQHVKRADALALAVAKDRAA